MKYAFLLTLPLLAPVAAAQEGIEYQHRMPPVQKIVVPRDLAILEVLPAFAMAPGDLTIIGQGFEAVTNVMVDGDWCPIMFQSGNRLVVETSGIGKPGFWPVVVQAGMRSAQGFVEYWPSVQVERVFRDTWGMGYDAGDGRLHLTLHNGAPGIFLVTASTELRPVPFTASSIFFEYYLRDPVFLLNGGEIPENGVVDKYFPWPAPLLTGDIYVQGWSSQFLTSGETSSFTNMLTMHL